MVSQTVRKNHDVIELYDLLEETYPNFHKREIGAAFKTGEITINGGEAYGDDIVKKGDKIGIFIADDLMGIDMTPQIVYQDENFVIVDKPAGLLSFSDIGEPNAVDMVEGFMKKQGEYSHEALMVPYLVYALDEFVSGLLLLAKHEGAYLFLVEALTQRRITRQYICPVKGVAHENVELMAYYLKSRTGKRVRILNKSQKGAKPIVTRYSVLSSSDKMSLLLVKPITNYMHQIRAHLAYDGFPVLGDSIYGDGRDNRKNRADCVSLWLKKVTFEVGKRHEYEYINGRSFESRQQSFPKCVYDEGLMKV